MSAVALALVFSRCSPVAPSISKNGFGGLPGPNAGPALPAPAVKVFRYKTRVLDGESYEEALQAQPSETQKVTLTDGQISEFIQHGKTDIQLPGAPVPDYGQGLFEVTLSRPEIEIQNLETFDTDLKPKDGTAWTLSIPTSVPANVSQSLRDRLVGVTLTVANEEPAASN
jgi:hypothetical protein